MLLGEVIGDEIESEHGLADSGGSRQEDLMPRIFGEIPVDTCKEARVTASHSKVLARSFAASDARVWWQLTALQIPLV